MKTIRFSSKTPEYAFLSNFYPAPFRAHGKEWATVEHFFQAMKVYQGHPDRERIRRVTTPLQAKRLGRRVDLRDDWNAVKEQVMSFALRKKFEQNQDLLRKLLATGDAPLIEDTGFDSYWGDGRDGEGLNRLGFLLMDLRDELQIEHNIMFATPPALRG